MSMKKIFTLITALTLCAGLWGEVINPGYNEPEGSFYSCYYFPSDGVASVQEPQLFMPYMDKYTFTSRHGAGDWKMGEQTATGAETFSPKYAFGTYTAEGMPELTASATTYLYGSGSTSVSARRVYVGDGAYHYMTNAKHYVVKQSTMVTQMSSYLKFRTYFFNRPDQVMLVSKILIPITTNQNGLTVADLFPAEDSHMKVAVYQATCSRTSLDKYSKAIDYSKRLVDTLTLTVKNYLQSSNAYAGILIAELPEPVSIKGAFCVEITDYETMGPETRLIGDNTTGTTSQYLKYKNAGDSQLTVYAASNNFEVAVYGAMPSIAKASETEKIEFPAIGGAADALAIYSSTQITAKEITLPNWANVESITYEDGSYAANKKINIVLSASANTTGAERTGEMVINNLGMQLTCAISQPSAPVAPYLIVGKKLTVNEKKDSELVYFQYFTYKNDERINGISGTNPKNAFELYDTEGYAEINYTNKDDVKRNFIVNPKIENAVDSIYQGETYLFADTLLTTAGTYQRTIESNTMTLTLKVKQKPAPAVTDYYLVGYINGASYGIDGDIDNFGDYHFVNGKVTATFTSKSYVQVKDNNKQIYGTAYYADAIEPDSMVLSVGATEKIGLPANVEITFTLTENADGTVTLAYTWGDTPTPPAPGPTVDETGITVNGRKYGFPVRLVKEVK